MVELLYHQGSLGFERFFAHQDKFHSSTTSWTAVWICELRFWRIGQSPGSIGHLAQAFSSRRSLRMVRTMSLDSLERRWVSLQTGQSSQGDSREAG